MTDLNKGNFNGKKEIFPGKKAVLALFVNRIIDPQDHIVVCDKVQSQPACIQKLVAKYIPVVIPFVMNVSHVKMGLAYTARWILLNLGKNESQLSVNVFSSGGCISTYCLKWQRLSIGHRVFIPLSILLS